MLPYIYTHTDMVIEGPMINIPTDFNFESPQFTISCTSSEGPVGCVEWFKNDIPITAPESTSTLIDPEEGRYTHVLTVHEHENAVGRYACNIYNNKPDIAMSIDLRVSSEISSTHSK